MLFRTEVGDMSRTRTHTRRRPKSNPRGIVRVTAAGHGIVKTPEGDYFIPASKFSGALDGDLVEVVAISPLKRTSGKPAKGARRPGDKPSARIIRVIERRHETLIGRYEIAEPFGVVVPEDTRIPYDIFTLHAENEGVCDGDIVRVRITGFPSQHKAATGIIEEVIGHGGDDLLAVDIIVARHHLETEFSAAALREAEQASIDTDELLQEGYRDLRRRTVFTVDPTDARDFDDALSFDEVGGTIRLGIHIADVSRYVPWNSSIDLDARRRATSVYLADRVIPMLPERLSNELCSLKPNEDRATMTLDLYLTSDAEVIRYEIHPALIRSSRRFTYEEVQGILDGKECEKEYRIRLEGLDGIAKKLFAARACAGGMEFSTTEARMILAEDHTPIGVALRRKTEATSLVEEAMILANNTVAAHLHKRGFPAIYRVHEKPSAESLAELVPLLKELGYLDSVPASAFIAGDASMLQRVLNESKGEPEEELVSSLLLRAMKRADYRSEADRHFGLASDAYTHFTSPIRRYPDLVVHRMLKAGICGRSGTFEQQKNSLAWLAEHSSTMERIAEEAARESQEYLLIEYMRGFIGQEFPAVISGVLTFGFFVRLENTAEGLVHLRHLGDEYFAFDAQRHMLMGEESGTIYRMGQKVTVVLDYANPREGRLDFHLASS